MLGSIIVVLLAVAIEHRGIIAPKRELLFEKTLLRVLLQNTAEVPGREIAKVLVWPRGILFLLFHDYCSR
ncbi:MAG: hypothetical protein K0B84_02320 [Firmicutes bacterium]|nr:hypothetical protein [Bacillota bacterium]